MRDNERLIPKRRFKEFLDASDWELCKLGESTIKIGSGKTPKGGNATYLTSGIPLLRSQNIYNDMVNLDDVVYISHLTNEEMLNSEVLQDDILLNITGASIGRSAVYGEKNAANVNQHVCIIRLKTGINPFFVHSYLVSEMGQKQIEMNQAGGGREGLNFKQISNFEFLYPSIVEQNKIANLFKKLNTSITLHQHKLQKLKALKTSYLYEMFPSKGKKRPIRRFDGFYDDWEQYELIEIADLLNNLRIPVTASDREKGNTPYYGANGIQDYVSGFTHEGEFVLIAEDGANNLINYPVNYVNGRVWVNNHAHVIQGKAEQLDNLFLASRIKSMNISSWLVGGGRAKLNGEDLKKIPVLIPSFSEQVKIGQFFKRLDDIIALQQKELKKMYDIKDAYLNEMFI